MEQDRTWMRHMWYRINDTIREQKKTKKDIAIRCGFDRKCLIGENNIAVEKLYKICKELNVSADYLLFGTEKRSLEELD